MRRRTAAVLLTLLLVAACGGDQGVRDDRGAALPPELRTVALGDSIMAGGGAPPYDAKRHGCYRSRSSWVGQLAGLLGHEGAAVNVDLVTDRSCGGARVEDLLRAQPRSGQPAQITPDPAADLVLVNIGANDVAYVELIVACGIGACAPLAARPEAHALFDQLHRQLVDELYPALGEAYPKARIVHVGYPDLTVPTGTDPTGCPWLDPEEQDALTATADRLAGVIEAAAGEARSASPPIDVHALRLRGALVGHELCSPDPWVNPIGGTDQAHPDAEGYGAMAAIVAASLLTHEGLAAPGA